jgi:hypothetical protein
MSEIQSVLNESLIKKFTPKKSHMKPYTFTTNDCAFLDPPQSIPLSSMKYIMHIEYINLPLEKCIKSKCIDVCQPLIHGFFTCLDCELQFCQKNDIKPTKYTLEEEVENDDRLFSAPMLEYIFPKLMNLLFDDTLSITSHIKDDDYFRFMSVIDHGILNIVKKYPEYIDLNHNYNKTNERLSLIGLMLDYNAFYSLEYCLQNFPVDIINMDDVFFETLSNKIEIISELNMKQYDNILEILQNINRIYNYSIKSSSEIYKTYLKNEDLKKELDIKSVEIENLKVQLKVILDNTTDDNDTVIINKD